MQGRLDRGILRADAGDEITGRMTVPPRGDAPLVIAAFSRRMVLRLGDGQDVNARIKGKRLKPVCGDRVEAMPIANEADWLITGILPRENRLSRPDSRGKTEVLAANLSFLVVVAADPPAPDWFIVDRYLCAAELMHIRAAVIFNKTDLAGPNGSVRKALAGYQSIGYQTLFCSAKTGSNINRLGEMLAGETAIIVGQSGVGKSSLINRLTTSARQPTAAVSRSTGEGRHTTAGSVMLALSNGGAVIDSPGVRDYAPSVDSIHNVAQGFREIAGFGAACRFSDCRHLREPDCAVKAAVDAGRVDDRRYESYRRLLGLTKKLADKQY